MIKKTLSATALLLCLLCASAQSELPAIEKVLNQFINGTMNTYPDSILSAFYPNTPMFLYNGKEEPWSVTSEEYADFYRRRPPGTKLNRPGRIVAVDVVLDVATAKLEFNIPSFGNRYHDLLLLKKIYGEWKIVGKATSAEPIPKAPQAAIPKPVKETVMEGLNRPWSMAFLSETEVIIAEKDGSLLRVDLDAGTRQDISGLPSDVARAVKIDTSRHAFGVFPPRAHGQTHSFNAGWFQVLLDPDFQDNNYIYLSYAAENEDKASRLQVVRGQLNGTSLDNVQTLFVAGDHTHGLFHYGGGMVFGSDKKLYITTGERNLFEKLNPTPPFSQDEKDGRGKVIRINPDGSIPEDNPDFGRSGLPGLYATGIRAAQGLAKHPETQQIWFSEHGTIQGDELNILQPGANYGWPYRTTGRYRTDDYQPVVPEGLDFQDPTFYWDKTVAPTGLSFYQGQEFKAWEGDLLVPGLSKGSLWHMVIEDDQVIRAEELFLNDRVRLRKVAISPRGKVYLLTDEENGKLIRLKNANF